MNAFAGELIGTAILIILGNGVVANVVLDKTKGNNSGWIVITFGWAIAVFVGVFAATKIGSSAHLNPAVTIGFAVAEKFKWEEVPSYLAAQFSGAILGALVVWICYYEHFKTTENSDKKRAVFCTSPAIRNTTNNFITELVGSFILVFAVFYLAAPTSSLGALDALPVALLVLGIGLSLGGPTGYAINPARDLAPRIVYALLPLGKKNSEWQYGWIPVIAPLIGGTLAALAFKSIG